MTTIQKTHNHRLEFHLGVGEDRNGKPIPTQEQAVIKDRLLRAVACVYGGASLTEQRGAWSDPKGRMILESGVTIVAYCHGGQVGDRIKMAGELLSIANQTACIVAWFHGTCGMVAQEVYA